MGFDHARPSEVKAVFPGDVVRVDIVQADAFRSYALFEHKEAAQPKRAAVSMWGTARIGLLLNVATINREMPTTRTMPRLGRAASIGGTIPGWGR
jgi:hypothetical protein